MTRYPPLLLAFAALLISVPDACGQAAKADVRKTIRASDGLNLVCEIRGKGDTAIIFLHGWCGDREYWKHQVDGVAADYRVVTLDQAGHGESGKDRKDWTVDSLAADVETVVKDLGLKRVILVGHSMGGSVALRAAKRLPGKVIAIIGVDTLQDAEKTVPEETKKQFFAAFEKDYKGTLEMVLGSLLVEKTDPDLRKWLTTRAAAQDQKMALALMKDMFGQGLKEHLKNAKVPIRCINSSGGFQFFTPTAVDINKKYADYDAVLMDNVGHYPMLEKPDEFNKKFREVLKNLTNK